LAKDWDVSIKEAQDILNLWYADRPEVREWQERRIELARQTGYTRTMLGRYRRLPDINSPSYKTFFSFFSFFFYNDSISFQCFFLKLNSFLGFN
jgi:DNA polymerase I-like protein with 3'-5' exonuclease and polymerase domains